MTTVFPIEAYSVFRHADRSILKLNPVLERWVYRFISVDIKSLETDFSDLLDFPRKLQSEVTLHLEELKISISKEFYDSVTNNVLFGHEMVFGDCIMLKCDDTKSVEVVDKYMDTAPAFAFQNEMQLFSANILQHLRFFNDGDIDCVASFVIDKDSRKVLAKHTNRPAKTRGLSKFQVADSDIEPFRSFFMEEFISNHLCELAIQNFNLAYEIFDVKTRFVTLMTCLEALFNQGRDQITHIVSRHLALIISEDKNTFLANYKRIKRLYQIRSTLVHGGTPDENIVDVTFELQRDVRVAINYCRLLNIDRKALFEKLNVMGF
jgi:hypothetical protein